MNVLVFKIMKWINLDSRKNEFAKRDMSSNLYGEYEKKNIWQNQWMNVLEKDSSHKKFVFLTTKKWLDSSRIIHFFMSLVICCKLIKYFKLQESLVS